ncbi:MAG: hypothetical protein ACLFM7_07785 [Bacteroidales bacterium]
MEVEPALHIDGGANGVMWFEHAGLVIKCGLDAGIQLGSGNFRYLPSSVQPGPFPFIPVKNSPEA